MIKFHEAHITEKEIESVSETLRSGWLTMGPKTQEFEQAFKEYIGCEYCVSVNSATAGLHLALRAIGLKAGDEVILPTTTFVATAEVVAYMQAVPILCDIDFNTHTLDVKKLELLISKKTKVIMPVHFAGIPCDMDALCELAKKHNIIVIEDAAHALPTTYKNKKVGTIGDITVFSFYATKTLATGEGGMICTHNQKWAEMMQRTRLHGMSREAWKRYGTKGKWHYEVLDMGYKYNMTDMNAALGLVQLEKLDWMNEQRKGIAMRYLEAFKATPAQCLFVPEDASSSWHLFVIKVKKRDQLIEELIKNEIGFAVHFIPLYLHQFYQKTFKWDKAKYPIAEKVYHESLSLPIWPGLSRKDQEKIIDVVCRFLNDL